MANNPPLTTTVLPHVKISWGGVIGNPGAEVWTNSIAWAPKDLNMSGVIADGLAGEQQNMAGLTAAIQNWYQTPANIQGAPDAKGAGIAPDAKLVWVKLNAVGSDGKYLFPSNTFFYPNPIPGGGTAFSQGTPYQPPWQMTTAITLRTTIARGRGAKGRIYPPLAGGGPDVGVPYQPAAVAVSMCNSFTGLLDNINSGLYMASGAPNPGTGYYGGNFTTEHPGNCVIVSTSPHTGPHAGAPALLTPILKVEVDRTADVQTRRVNRVARSVTSVQTVTLNT